nr:glycosyltransferase family 4 protein [uncultured Psychroserpens sp.]
MKKILYIGNRLQKQTSNTSYISILGDFLSSEGYVVYYASSLSNKLMRMMDMVKSCLYLSRKVDLVLIDTYSTQNFYYAFVISQLCRVLKIAYMPILHGGNLPQRLKLHPKKSRMVFKHAKCNVSPSFYLKIAFEDYGYTNIVHIPNTIDIQNYPFTHRNYEVPKLLWVRSFSEIYNPKLAIYVFKLLKETYPNAELCMVGPDSDGSFKVIKDLNQNLSLNTKFTGKLTKDEWINLSKDYNIFINTTNFDNMPLSVIEAMALGLPVVSTNVGGMPYLIKDKSTGFLVKPNNASEMAKAILDVIDNDINREMIIKSARTEVEQFDWKHVKKKWFNILMR